jgi:hypothetical protein
MRFYSYQCQPLSFLTLHFLYVSKWKAPSAKYTVKKVSDISVPSRDVTYQTVPERENLNYYGDGNVTKHFYGVQYFYSCLFV